jgi:DNA-binding FrmR family transcriptional regulator
MGMANPAHASHPAVATRLKRAEGHLRAVIAMIEAGEPCLCVAQQLQAVEKAVMGAKRTPIHEHMDHCLDAEGPASGRVELRAIARYL